MKKIREIIEEQDGLEALLGEVVVLFCANYFYTGRLVGVNETCVKLEDPSIIYETGRFTPDQKWADAQSLCVGFWYVKTSAIESFGVKGG